MAGERSTKNVNFKKLVELFNQKSNILKFVQSGSRSPAYPIMPLDIHALNEGSLIHPASSTFAFFRFN